MKRLVEAAVFVGLAIGLHVVIAMRVPSEDGAEAGGAGGQALVTMKGAPPGTVEMIEQWETPPEAVTEPEPAALQTEAVSEPAPELPTAVTSPSPAAMPRMELPDAMPDTASLPKVEMDVPSPPEPEPEPEEMAEQPPEPDQQPEPEPEDVAEPVEIAEVAPEQPDQTTPTVSKRPLARPREVERAPEPAPRREPQPQRTQQARAGGEGGATQRAAGSGGTSQAGNGQASERAANAGQQAKLASVWGGRIRARIERRKRFPNSARGQTGTVIVRVTVAADGTMLGYSVLRSSGNAAFDQAAMQAIRSAGRMPAAPSGLNEASRTYDLPMAFNQ